MRRLLIFLLLLTVYGVMAQTPSTDPHWAKNNIFSDEFNRTRNAVWHDKLGAAGSAISRPQNILYGTADGRQYIRFIGEMVNGTPYTGGIETGRLITGHLGLGYGYYEIEARLLQTPNIVSGLWPAFWLWHHDNTPPCWYEELDIFEPGRCRVSANNHGVKYHYNHSGKCPANAGENWISKTGDKYVDMSQWHKYAVEWLEGRVTFYTDDEAFFVISDDPPFHQNTTLFIDLQTELFVPDWCPPNIYNGILGYFDVNYFRYHKLKYDCTGSTSVVNEIANYNTFNYAVKKSISLSGISSLSSGQNVALRAADFIELKDGFYVPADAELYLDNNPCENTGAVIKGE
jgi:beta-glucanase (GH16 family)